MWIREQAEDAEVAFLSPYAAKSVNATRQKPMEGDELRTAFQRDRDRIIHSNAFRRLKHKTQVYIAPSSDHYRTRMTHTLEVGQIGRTIARALRLNEDLTEAIAMGHDVGHTPFGHVGEAAIQDMIGHFKHNEQSLRVVDVLEKDGEGLNLTNEVRDGILGHTGPTIPYTLEGQIVRTADRIAYLCHDFDDSLRAGLLTSQDLPLEVRRVLGTTPSQMITTMVRDMVTSSDGQPSISMSKDVEDVMNIFRKFMFHAVYLSPPLMEDRNKAAHVVKHLFTYYKDHPDILRNVANIHDSQEISEINVIDYVAGLSDQYAIEQFKRIFTPHMWGT